MAAETVDRMAVELVADGSKVLDEWFGVKEEMEKSAGELRDSISNIMSDADIFGRLVAHAREMGTTLEESARALANLPMVGGASFETLTALIDRFNERIQILPFITDAMKELATSAKDLGVELTQAQLDDKTTDLINLAATADTNDEAFRRVNAELAKTTENLVRMSEAQDKANKKMQEANPVAKFFSDQLKSIVTGLLGIVGIAQVGQVFIKFLKESFAEAVNFSEAMTRLAIEVRANQREFGESAGTIREWGQFVRDLAQRYIGPTATEIAAATARALAMGDAMDLTTEQMQGLIEASNVLAIAQGRDLQSVLTAFIGFLNTGYSVGIRNLGVDLQKLERQSGRTFREMSSQERAALVLPEILAQAAERSEDLAAAQETLAGRMNKANQRLDDAQLIVGGLLAPAFVGLNEAAAAGAELLAILLVRLVQLAAFVPSLIGGFVAGWWTMVNAIVEGTNVLEAWSLGVATIFETTDTGLEIARLRFEELINTIDGLKDVEGSIQGVSDATRDLGENADEAIDVFLRLAREYGDGMDRIRQSFERAMADITLDLRRKQADALTDLQRDIEDIDRDAAERRLQVIRDNQIDELRLRQDHLLDIRRLEESYLLELEDAVRERDARQVLLLMRRFNLEKQRREEDYTLRQLRMRQDFLLELAAIERQRQIRRAERMEAYRLELEDLALQAERRRADALENAEREKIDLIEAARRKLIALQGGLDDERELRLAYLAQFYKDLKAYIGPNGYMDDLYRYARLAAIAASASIATMAHATPVFAHETPTFLQSKNAAKGSDPFKRFQRGGEFIATSPTSIMVGERPEMVDVTPLGAGGSPIAGMRDGAGEPVQVHLMVDAEEGLAVRVADHTMSRMADIVVNITRHAPGGGPR